MMDTHCATSSWNLTFFSQVDDGRLGVGPGDVFVSSNFFVGNGEFDFGVSKQGDGCLEIVTSNNEFCRKDSARLGVFNIGLGSPKSIPESTILEVMEAASALRFRPGCNGP